MNQYECIRCGKQFKDEYILLKHIKAKPCKYKSIKHTVESAFKFNQDIQAQRKDILSRENIISQPYGFVYFVYSPEMYQKNNYVKVGKTNDLQKRKQQLQTGNPFKIEFYKTIESNNYHKLERIFHQIFNDRKVLNEWFVLSLSEVDSEIEKIIANNTDKNITYTLCEYVNCSDNIDNLSNVFKNTKIEIPEEKKLEELELINLFQNTNITNFNGLNFLDKFKFG